MAIKTITIFKEVERRTFIKGSFFGKYYGNLDETKYCSDFEKYYDINVYEGEIFDFEIESLNPEAVNKIKYTDFKSEIHFLQETFNNIISKSKNNEINGFDTFRLKIHKPKLQNIVIDNVIKEDNETFGTFTAIVFGYIVDTIIVEEEIEVEYCTSCDTEIGNCNCNSLVSKVIDNNLITSLSNNSKYSTNESQVNTVSYNTTKYSKKTSRVKTKRPVVSYSKNSGCLDFFSFIGNLILIILAIVFVISIGLNGIVTILLIGVVIFGITFFSAISRFMLIGFNLFFRLLYNLLGIFSLILFFVGIISIFNGSYKSEIKRENVTNVNEKTTIKPIANDIIVSDSIISHHRVWKDYDNNVYEGDLDILKNDFNLSFQNRTNSQYKLDNNKSWMNLYSHLINFDMDKLNMINLMFSDIRKENNLNPKEFAEVIVSCIQDIDYKLVLENNCNPNLYNDEFIKEYLTECINCCIGNVKYGVQSPVEFMTNLYGDCDTRTILIYSILSNFGYDVVVLGSTQYRHSIIGINLPYYGKYKIYNGKKYYVWETTSIGYLPGIIPSQQSNMNLWSVHLNNKN